MSYSLQMVWGPIIPPWFVPRLHSPLTYRPRLSNNIVCVCGDLLLDSAPWSPLVCLCANSARSQRLQNLHYFWNQVVSVIQFCSSFPKLLKIYWVLCISNMNLRLTSPPPHRSCGDVTGISRTDWSSWTLTLVGFWPVNGLALRLPSFPHSPWSNVL